MVKKYNKNIDKMKRGRVGFLKPREDDDLGCGYQEDRPDLDTNSQTTFVYNPFQVSQTRP